MADSLNPFKGKDIHKVVELYARLEWVIWRISLVGYTTLESTYDILLKRLK